MSYSKPRTLKLSFPPDQRRKWKCKTNVKDLHWNSAGGKYI